jgi:diguanylate cyclase (GGDEF)-like protein
VRDEEMTKEQLLGELARLKTKVAEMEGLLESCVRGGGVTDGASDPEKVMILEGLSELISSQHPQIGFRWVSRSECESFVVSGSGQADMRCFQALYSRTQPCASCPVLAAWRSGQLEMSEVTTADGRVWLMLGNPVEDAKGNVFGVIEVSLDVTDYKRVQIEEKAGDWANYDAVTGLPNRLLFHDRLAVAINHARRYKRHVIVMAVDLGAFPSVTAKLGQRTGEVFLKSFIDRLKDTLRRADTIARFEDGTVALILPEIVRMRDGTEIARKIIDSCESPISWDTYTVHVTLNIGIAIYPNDGEDQDMLLERAFAALENAKRIGTNTYYYFNTMRNIDELVGP